MLDKKKSLSERVRCLSWNLIYRDAHFKRLDSYHWFTGKRNSISKLAKEKDGRLAHLEENRRELRGQLNGDKELLISRS